MSNQSPTGSVVSTIISTAIQTRAVDTLDLGQEGTVSPLQLDDVQSALPLDPQLVNGDRSAYMRFFLKQIGTTYKNLLSFPHCSFSTQCQARLTSR